MINQDGSLEKEILSELIPLREPTLFILLALSNGRKHGYAILKEVEGLSEGRITLSTGTLYGGLARLLQQGVVRKSPISHKVDNPDGEDEDPSPDLRRRKYYELTGFGQRVLEVEIERLKTILAAAGRQLGEERI